MGQIFKLKVIYNFLY